MTYDADGYVNTSDLNRIDNAVSGNDLRVWNVDSKITYSSGVLSFGGVDLALADEYTIFLNDGGTGKTTTPSRLARDYEKDNFKGVISAVYDDDAVIEVYVDEDNSIITDETVAEVEEAVSEAVKSDDGAWGRTATRVTMLPTVLGAPPAPLWLPPLSSPPLIASPIPLSGIPPASWAPCTARALPPSCMTV